MLFHRLLYRLPLIIVLMFFVIESSNSQALLRYVNELNNPTYFQIRDAYNEYFKDIPEDQRRGYKQFKRWEWFWETRVNENGEFPDAYQAYKGLQSYKNKYSRDVLLANNPWTLVGPIGKPKGESVAAEGIGRVNISRFDPNNDNIIWAGAAGGGVWKSTDGGNNYIKFPFTQFLSLGISDIGIAPTNSNVVYVVTGDADGAGATTKTINSIGVIKTTDGGNSWNVTNLNYYLNDRKILGRLLVDPENENIVLVCGSDGILKTTDGGETWEKKQSGNFIDMEFNPWDTDIIYASTRKWGSNQIFLSEDGGESWAQVFSVSNSSRIALGVSEANGDVVYGLVAHSGRYFHSLVKSENSGKTWATVTNINTAPNILDRHLGDDYAGQGEYDLAIDIAPWDDNEIWTGGINVWKSSNGGESWEQKTHWYGYKYPFVHADIHDIVMNPNTGALLVSHDGGIDISNDLGNSWKDASSNLSIMQFYALSVSQTETDVVYGGSQDNGTNRQFNGRWENIYGGDGMECIVSWADPNYIYVSLPNGQIRRSANQGKTFIDMIDEDKTGENGGWVTPYVMSLQNSSVLYVGYNNVYKVTSYGSKFEKISTFGDNSNQSLRTLAVSPSQAGVIYAANTQRLYATFDDGKNWNQITGAPGNIMGIAVDPQNPARIWVASSNYNDNNKVYEYDGSSWKNISGNLPNVPANTIVYQPNSPDRLYVGTDIGVFYSDYNSGYWEEFNQSLPNIVVMELEIHNATNTLYAATFGGGIWKADLIDCNLTPPQVSVNGNIEFCQGDSVVLTADKDYSGYDWSTGEKTKSIVIKESGEYSLLIKDNDGCTARSQAIRVNVLESKLLEIEPKSGFPVCEGDPINVVLEAKFGFTEYKWSTGETERKITVSNPGNYSVEGLNANGCTSYSEVFVIKVNPNPEKPIIQRYNSNQLIASDASAYQWYFEDNLIEGAVNKVLDINEIGNYSVDIFNESGCSALSDPYMVISGVEELTSDDKLISVSPNPSSGIFNLVFKESIIGSDLTVYNPQGMKIFERKGVNDNGFVIDLTPFPSGVYILRAKTGGHLSVMKLIKN